jgi:hypothetical protein
MPDRSDGRPGRRRAPTDGPVERARVADALRRWRQADHLARVLDEEDPPGAYERAIALAARSLQAAGSMASLLAYDEESAAVTAACVRAACACASPNAPMVLAAVRGAAFWRRLRALLADAPRAPS